jgi:2-oxoglutarate dehydrogenase E2 component (dihydrolipoamide succinyltransferase)
LILKATLEPAEASGIITLKAEEECSSSRSSGLFDTAAAKPEGSAPAATASSAKLQKQLSSRAKAAPATYASGTPSPAARKY